MRLPQTYLNSILNLLIKKTILFLLLVGTLFISACKSEKKEVVKTTNPNILFIAVDDLNNWISPIQNFSNVKTPNFERLAKMVVTFTNAHVQAPLCGPSRASIMTGLRPSTSGIYGMTPDNKIRRPGNPATKDITFLPEQFSNKKTSMKLKKKNYIQKLKIQR